MSRQGQGFTLLEMLVVLAIAALITGIGAPAIERVLAGQAFRADLAKVESELASARADAIRTGFPVRASLNDGGRALAITGKPQQKFAEGTVLVGVSMPVIFFDDGSSTGGVLDLKQGKRVARIEIEAPSGRIRVDG